MASIDKNCGKSPPWEDIYDSLPVSIWCASPDGTILCANATAAAAAGFDVETLKGMNVKDVYPQAAKTFVNGHAEVVRTGKPQTGVVEQYVDNAGRQRWSYCNRTPQKDPDGKVKSVVMMAVDVTSEKLRDVALSQSEERYRLLFESIHSSVCVCKPLEDGSDFVVIGFNSAAEKLEGVNRKDVIGKRITEAFPGVRDMGLIKVMQTVWSSGEPQYHPASVYYDQFRSGWRENYVYKLPGGEVVCVYDDVTDKKKMATKLNDHIRRVRESEERLRFALESTKLGHWDMDVGSMKIAQSTRCSYVFGYTTANQEWEYSAFLDHVVLGCQSNVDTRFRHAIRTGEDLVVECQINRVGGDVRWIWMCGQSVRNDEGKPVRFVGLIQDITDKKNSERRQAMMADILQAINQPNENLDMVKKLLLIIREYSGVHAVGIRLKDGNDYPYCHTIGFSPSFVSAENNLMDQDRGEPSADSQSSGCGLQCMCGAIIQGIRLHDDRYGEYFSRNGSFWTNSMSAMKDNPPAFLSNIMLRNRCHKEGFESMALIPLRANAEIIGMLQLNDRRRNRFSSSDIEFYESMAESIGIAFSRKQTRDEIDASRRALQRANHILAIQAELTKGILSSDVPLNLTAVLAGIGVELKCKAVAIYEQGASSKLAVSWIKQGESDLAQFEPNVRMSMDEAAAVRSWIKAGQMHIGTFHEAPASLSPMAKACPPWCDPMSCVIIPISIQGKPWGVVNFMTGHNKPWADDELSALASLGGMLALYLEVVSKAKALEKRMEETISEMTSCVHNPTGGRNAK